LDQRVSLDRKNARTHMTEPGSAIELEALMVTVYRGPLDEFVSRRDALAKQLRGAKRREDADRVKLLRKPSRMAWVLDNLVVEDSASIEQLVAAIGEAQRASDLRAALEIVRAAVRAVSAAGARVAIRAGQPIEANAIAAAVNAVIGDGSAFAEWRAGRLVDVPEAGGLDMLSAIQVSAPAAKTSSSPQPSREPEKSAARAESATRDAEVAKAARAERFRAELLRAETSLAEMRKHSEHALEMVRGARESLDAAERELVKAESEVQSRRTEVERAQRDAAAAASAMQDAERAVTAARASAEGHS
jgi:hypothetical protein